jgi:hypothetical protein
MSDNPFILIQDNADGDGVMAKAFDSRYAKSHDPFLFWKDVQERYEKDHPDLLQKCVPRRYIPPGGYANPLYLYTQMASHIFVEPNAGHQVASNTQVATWKALEMEVPTYFVGREFIEAVAATAAPKNMLISDMRFPLDSMAFVLPLEFSRQYFGILVPFIVISRIPKGLTHPPQRLERWVTNSGGDIYGTKLEKDRVVVYSPVLIKNVPIDYSSCYETDTKIEDAISSQTELKEYIRDLDPTSEFAKVLKTQTMFTDEQEKELNGKVMALAIKLVLMMVARPTLVESSTLQRKASSKRGKTKSELWSPNIIGWKYRIKREIDPSTVGTGGSVRLHWRGGHFRWQPFMENLSYEKLLWIEATLVGDKNKGKQ